MGEEDPDRLVAGRDLRDLSHSSHTGSRPGVHGPPAASSWSSIAFRSTPISWRSWRCRIEGLGLAKGGDLTPLTASEGNSGRRRSAAAGRSRAAGAPCRRCCSTHERSPGLSEGAGGESGPRSQVIAWVASSPTPPTRNGAGRSGDADLGSTLWCRRRGRSSDSVRRMHKKSEWPSRSSGRAAERRPLLRLLLGRDSSHGSRAQESQLPDGGTMGRHANTNLLLLSHPLHISRIHPVPAARRAVRKCRHVGS